jgi:hypothetical protein
MLLTMPGINRKPHFAPSFGNRVVRTQLGRMPRNEMADMLEGRFVQAGGRNLAFCLAEGSTCLAVLARVCDRPIDDLFRLWKTRWLTVSLCQPSTPPRGNWEKTRHNKKSPQQIAENSSQSYSCTL